MKPWIMKSISSLSLTLFLGLVSGCGGYTGRYEGNGKSVEVESSDRIWAYADSESNIGKITSTTKSSDGKIVTIKGELDYSGGSGTAFGVTVTSGNERHWHTPFTATIDTTKKTMTFEGSLMVNSQDRVNLDGTYKKN